LPRNWQAGLCDEVAMTNEQRDALLTKIDKELSAHVARCEAMVETVKQLNSDVNGNGREGLKSQVNHLRKMVYGTAATLLVLLGAVAKGLAARWL